MNYSAILVGARPGRLASVIEALQGIPGVEAHQRDEASSRVICSIEAQETDDEVRLFRTVSELDGVLDASLLEHRTDVR